MPVLRRPRDQPPVNSSTDGQQFITGDSATVLAGLEPESVQCVVTSPPYWGLRKYGDDPRMLGSEPTPDEYVAGLVDVFQQVRRVLRKDGTLWLNLGDSYTSGGRVGHGTRVGYKQQTNRGMCGENDPSRPLQVPGLKPKDLIGIPWRVALALQADGWWLRSDIIWHKPNPMPESVTDRPTKAHEYLFLLTKSARYHYDAEAIKEESVWQPGSREDKPRGSFGGKNTLPGKEAFRAIRETRNCRDVWTIATQNFKGAHFATFPQKLVEPCILAGCPVGGTVLDPFCGAGTVALVARRLGRRSINIDLNAEYIAMAQRRLIEDSNRAIK